MKRNSRIRAWTWRLYILAVVLTLLWVLAGCAQSGPVPLSEWQPDGTKIVLVQIVPRPALEAEWARQAPDRAAMAPNVGAFARFDRPVCRIWMTPATALPLWRHELRHCYERDWHGND